jgi:predicted DNA-binding transcriptional regulator AlpA
MRTESESYGYGDGGGSVPQRPRNGLLLDAQELAEELRLSLRHVRRLDDTGKLPRPIRLGKSVRWARAEIVRWIEAGCPDRATWEEENLESA